MMQAILECKNLTKKFGRKTALDDVSLQLKKWEDLWPSRGERKWKDDLDEADRRAVKAGKGRDLLRGTSALCKRQRIDRLYGNGKFLL